MLTQQKKVRDLRRLVQLIYRKSSKQMVFITLFLDILHETAGVTTGAMK